MESDCGDHCLNGVLGCWCSSEGPTIDLDSTKGLGDIDWVKNENYVLSESDSDEEIENLLPEPEDSIPANIPATVDEVVAEVPCPLCLSDSKPKEGVSNLKIQCHGGCNFSCHFECYLDAMKKQGLTKKREYKDSSCPTDGCEYLIYLVHKIRLNGEDELYVMGASKVKPSKPVARTEKMKDYVAHQQKEHSCKPEKKETSHEVIDFDALLHEDVPQSAEMPCSSKQKAAPLGISEPVIPLEKKTSEIEDKYAVSTSTATWKKNVKKPKKNEKVNITEVLMKSKGDEIQKMKSTEKVRRHVAPVEEVTREAQELAATTSAMQIQPIESSTATMLDDIADKLKPYLPELVLNTPKWSPNGDFLSDDLCTAILAVGINIFSDEEITEIEKLFLGGFLQINEFVEKLKYFTCSKDGYNTKVIKNDLGKLLEEERNKKEDAIDRSESSTISTVPSVHECLICLEEDSVGLLHCDGCNKPFHSICIIPWLTKSGNCPHCRINWPDPVAFPPLS